MSQETLSSEQVSPFIKSPRCNTYNSTFNKQPESIGKSIVRCRGHRRSSNLQQTSTDLMNQSIVNIKSMPKRYSNM